MTCKYQSCKTIKNLIIPKNVKSIGEKIIGGCKSIEKIVVENGNKIYDSRNDCNAIIEKETNKLIAGCQNTIIPNTVTTIGEEAFSGCTELISLKISNSVKTIEDFAFFGCKKLTMIVFPDYLEKIGKRAFCWCNELKSLTLPPTLTEIGDEAFYCCSGLTNIDIPNTVTTIGSEAFYQCINLKSLTIPNSVERIKHDAFQGCSKLESLVIPFSIKEIGGYAFALCTNLTTIYIPSSLTFINDGLFWKCESLKDIYYYSEVVPNTSVYAFKNYNYKDATLHVPAQSIGNYQSSSPWKEFGNIVALTEEEIAMEVINLPFDEVHEVGRFSLDGKRVTPSYQGLVVIKYNDGTTRKVIVR